MLEFPRLKTGVSAQYPVQREILGETRTFTFLDGKQQRFPVKRLRRRWVIRFRDLSEEEAAAVEEFAFQHRETGEAFRFLDPVTGREHFPCYLEGRSQVQSAVGPGRRESVVVIVEGGG